MTCSLEVSTPLASVFCAKLMTMLDCPVLLARVEKAAA